MRFVLLLAVLTLGVALPVGASANTGWFYERQAIAEGETVEVASSSANLSVVLKTPKGGAVKIPCTANGVEAFWNTPAGGRDETQSIGFSCGTARCGRAVVTPLLPWTSTLLESPPPLIDEWEGVALELTCGAVDYGLFTGKLEAKAGDVDPPGKGQGKDDLDNLLTFRGGVNRPLLRAPNGDAVWFTGRYRLGTKGHGITDESGA